MHVYVFAWARVLLGQYNCDSFCCRDSHHGNSSYCGFIKIDDYESPDGVSEQMSDIKGRTSVCHLTSHVDHVHVT